MNIMDKLRDTLRVDKFNGNDNEDFSLWSIRIMAVLEGRGIHGVVLGEETEPQKEDTSAYTTYAEKVSMARAIIVTALGDKPLRVIQNSPSPKEMWDKLRARYEAATTANKINLLTALVNTRYESGKDLGDYFAELETYFNRLAGMGLPVAEEMQVAILLVSVMHEETLKGTVAALKTVEDSKATWNNVCSRLLEEHRSQRVLSGINARSSSNHIRAATIRRRTDKENFKIRCYNCNKLGHIARNCKADRKDKSDDKHPKIRIATVTKGQHTEGFIMDSGASQHISNDLKMFSSIENISPVTVHLADNTLITAKQEGTVTLDLMSLSKGKTMDTRIVVTKVLYIPEAALNILSCSQLDRAGISSRFDNGMCLLLDRKEKNRIIGHASPSECEGLYLLQAQVYRKRRPKSLFSARSHEAKGEDLWHRRFGHVDIETIRKMPENYVEGMDLNITAQSRHCGTCLEAKQTKAPTTGKLAKSDEDHIVHSDVIGPIHPQTLGNSRYIVTFIVEKSRFAKVYVINQRAEVQDRLLEFIAWLERMTGTSVKRFHSDQAKEYVALRTHFRQNGIVQTFSSAYTPESNGLAERYNRTLLTKVRAMLVESGLNPRFWGEAALHAAYLHNVTSSSSNNGKTPFELLFGRKPNVGKLRVFGCSAHLHVPLERRSWKLASRSRAGIMVGLENGLYRIWDIEQETLVGTKHVLFDETVFPARNETEKQIFSPSFLGVSTEDPSAEEKSVEIDIKQLTETEDPDGGSERPLRTDEEVQENASSTEATNNQNKKTIQRYPQRERSKPNRYAYIARKGAQVDTPTVEEALQSSESHQWKRAMKEELKSLEETGTWEIVDQPQNVQIVPCKWVLKLKRNADGKSIKYKARLVICGNLDDSELSCTFAPVVDFTVIRLMLAIATQKQWEIHQVDYSSAFLQGTLHREVYMTIPKYMEGNYSKKVCKLKKTLYGLRESPRIWYDLLSRDLMSIGLMPLKNAPCVFVQNRVIVLCYVDDLLLLGEDEEDLRKLKSQLVVKLPANDLGKATDFLGIKIRQEQDYIGLGQKKQIMSLVEELGLSESRETNLPCDLSIDLSTAENEVADPSFPYRRVVGVLLYIATHTRPDIALVTSMLARHVENPSMKHQQAVIKTVKYLNTTKDHGIILKPSSSTQLRAHADANWAGEPGAGRRSRSGVVIYYGSAVIYYRSSLQKCVTLSSTEAEYVALSESAKVVVWLRRILNELEIRQDPTAIMQDNSGAIRWASGHPAEDFKRSKHVELRYHYIRDKIVNGEIRIEKISSNDMAADFLTKPLGGEQMRIANARVQVVDLRKSNRTDWVKSEPVERLQ